ncbi:MAG TPA: PEPxxWA-CTERM sorting domain-containing protein [Caulobacteraceae bacterium]|jgi:choice-of-anchor C domain-containing protein|nr:PEPxxWA-CTERM sorting domain-containing protein [Caulobacteraceae bacterium]
MSKTGALATGAIVLALAAGGAAHAATDLVSDPEFNSPYGGSVFTTYYAGQSFGAWTVLSGSIDLIGGYWQELGSGEGSVDVNGRSDGTFGQSIATGTGTYRLTFDLSGNPVGSPATKTLQVSVGNVSKTFTYTIGKDSLTNMMYVPESLTFKATGPTFLTFQSLDNASTFYGPVVANIDISAVPEPVSWALMLLGLGAMGGALRSQRLRVSPLRV